MNKDIFTSTQVNKEKLILRVASYFNCEECVCGGLKQQTTETRPIQQITCTNCNHSTQSHGNLFSLSPEALNSLHETVKQIEMIISQSRSVTVDAAKRKQLIEKVTKMKQ